MSKAQVSSIFGLIVAGVTVAINSGLFGHQASTAQTVLNAVIAFAATVGIRSAKPSVA